MPPTSRRRFLQQTGAASLVLAAPGLALAAASTERRFVFILQRGAADGLETVIPYADPAYARLRGALAVDTGNTLKLDGSFALHPSLAEVGKLYTAQQALFVHAVASPYRERSHFDGQDVVESGGATPQQLKDGWLNRLVAQLPGTPAASGDAIAIAPTIPLALRGPAAVSSFAPTSIKQAPDDFVQRVQQLYAQDPQLHAMWSTAMETRGMAGAQGARQSPRELGQLAASFLAKPQGPRIAMLEMGGWDTHSAQTARLSRQLQGLDALIAALRDGLGTAWSQTVVLVATEFGRTAAANGTGGTDHGTAAVAMLIGGAVQGGRMLGDWPGLAIGSLYQGRDLQPTTDLHALLAAAAGQCFGIEPGKVARAVFPQLAAPTTLPDLVRAA